MSWISAIVLCVIAALHLLWAVGIWVPIRDEAALAKAVVGRPGIVQMPPAAASAAVAAALFFVAIAVLWTAAGLRDLVLSISAIIFALRGLASYAPAFRRVFPEHPFATLDRRYYGPLCLLLAIGITLSI